MEERMTKKNATAVKISPWALARLNGEEALKAAAEARRNSKILRPVVRHESPYPFETDSSLGMVRGPDTHWKQGGRCIRIPTEMPFSSSGRKSMDNIPSVAETSTSSATPYLEARTAFQPNQAISGHISSSSPESSLDSTDLNLFQRSSLGLDEPQRLAFALASHPDIPLSRSTSDASGGEDSNRGSAAFLSRQPNWTNILFGSDASERSMPNLGSRTSSYEKESRRW